RPYPRLQTHLLRLLQRTSKRQAVMVQIRGPITTPQAEPRVRTCNHMRLSRSPAGSQVIWFLTVIRGGTAWRQDHGTSSFARQLTTYTTMASHNVLSTRFSWTPMCRSVKPGFNCAGVSPAT